MGEYIASAQENIRAIMAKIRASDSDARYGLVAYRDHPPQDSTFVTRTFPFTSSASTMQRNVDWMSAAGGGDGPEAVSAALHATLVMPWRSEAAKVVVLIADAPPHGLGERGDGFPNGCPLGHDPLAIAREMVQCGITVYAVGCEPALGYYSFARDFFLSIADITQGQAVTLGSARLLADVILGGAAEEMGMEKLMRNLEQRVEQEMAAGGDCDEEAMIARVAEAMQQEGVRCQQMRHDGSCRPTVRSKQISAMPSLCEWRAAAPAAAPAPCGAVGRRSRMSRASASMPRSRRRMSQAQPWSATPRPSWRVPWRSAWRSPRWSARRRPRLAGSRRTWCRTNRSRGW